MLCLLPMIEGSYRPVIPHHPCPDFGGLTTFQPMEKTVGGLSQVEERVLHELALGAGARRAVVWVGQALSDREVSEKCRRG